MLLKSLHLENILSFGPDGVDLEMRPLNVLIGPNGSGKSNLIEIIGLLAAAPRDIQEPLRTGGGLQEWVCKLGSADTATVEAVVESRNKPVARYRLELSSGVGHLPRLTETIHGMTSRGTEDRVFHYEHDHGILHILREDEDKRFPTDALQRDQSVLSQIRSPLDSGPMGVLRSGLERVRFHREWAFGRRSAPKLPQPADARNDFLAEDGSNLGLMLNVVRRSPEHKRTLLTALHRLYDGIDDVDVIVQGGAVQVFLQEGRVSIPGTRLSDGTLRYLCLLAILCHPEPPPLVCIEEPELGLHPDILPGLADLLRDASERMQLVVTTHSDVLVDALTDTPESIVTCEKDERGTHLRRLDKEQLKPWLEKYRLGELWTSGELGGNRW